MKKRTLQSALNELREEQHVPMTKLVEEMSRQDWAANLNYDVSMLRLWLSHEDYVSVEVMVTYGDGRGGGRPSEPFLDVFETKFFVGADVTEVTMGTAARTIKRLRLWLESKQQ
jgi:hypothetical protein